jgi:hypothetical protein
MFSVVASMSYFSCPVHLYVLIFGMEAGPQLTSVMRIERGFQHTKLYSLWMLFATVVRVESFIGRLHKVVRGASC